MTILNGYATLAELKAHLGTPTANTDNDTLFERVIERASRMIDRITNTFFFIKTLTNEIVDACALSIQGVHIGENLKTMYFPAPIITITSIVENGESLTEGADYDTANPDYYLYLAAGYIERSGYWTSSRKGIKITGAMGYAATPDDINSACIEIAAVMSNRDIKSITDEFGEDSTAITRFIPVWVNNILATRRRINV
jgi:hypothetical protein